MKKIENKIMLITYANTLGGSLAQLERVLAQYFPGAFGGIHILPFFPSSGDQGFAVIRYDIVDPRFGTWDDVDRLGQQYYLMADFMLNHISIRSEEFRDYMHRGDVSPFREMFIHWDTFWPGGEPSEEELNTLYRRKAGGPYRTFVRDDGAPLEHLLRRTDRHQSVCRTDAEILSKQSWPVGKPCAPCAV